MINSERTTQRSVMEQRNVFHSTVGIVASGYAMPGSDIRTVARKFSIGGFAFLRGVQGFAFVCKNSTDL